MTSPGGVRSWIAVLNHEAAQGAPENAMVGRVVPPQRCHRMSNSCVLIVFCCADHIDGKHEGSISAQGWDSQFSFVKLGSTVISSFRQILDRSYKPSWVSPTSVAPSALAGARSPSASWLAGIVITMTT